MGEPRVVHRRREVGAGDSIVSDTNKPIGDVTTFIITRDMSMFLNEVAANPEEAGERLADDFIRLYESHDCGEDTCCQVEECCRHAGICDCAGENFDDEDDD